MSHELDQIIDGLKQSPLFQLSLASKELFHSNFLAWLCVTYPDHAGRLFAAFLNYTPPTCGRARRSVISPLSASRSPNHGNSRDSG